MADPKVLIVMGSANDKSLMEGAWKVLSEFGVPYEHVVASAHRTPAKAAELASNAKERGVKLIIAGAGFAAHLGGVLAAHTTLPIIGVPLDSSALSGLDSLLSTVQMPGGIPVATMTIGKAGAKNAGLFAVSVLALSDEGLSKKLEDYRKAMAEKVEAANAEL